MKWTAVLDCSGLSLVLGLAPAPTAPQPPSPAPAPVNAAVVPVSRDGEPSWKERFHAVTSQPNRRRRHIILIGDSITQGWENTGADAWSRAYPGRPDEPIAQRQENFNPLNLGFSGDHTQHVLWRLEHSKIDELRPRVAVIMIGTNNRNGDDHTAEQIAEGITAIVESVRAKLPPTEIILLGIFPRGERPDAQREKISRVNEIIRKLDEAPLVTYLDIGAKLMNADGTISRDIMPEFLHLSPKGYEIWAEAMKEAINSATEPLRPIRSPTSAGRPTSQD
jgi:beta-glucosidase